jgi:RimJ/RimL family protein N-acetyltransferase
MERNFKEELLKSIDNKRFEVKDNNGELIAFLSIIKEDDINDNFLIEKMTLWRRKYLNCFLSIFEPSNKRTHDWIKYTLLPNSNRVLFKIYTKDSQLVGHIGAIFCGSFIEYDYFIKGEKVDIKDFAVTIARRFLYWICEITAVDKIIGRVRSDNSPTIDFHLRTGFKINKKIPLKRNQQHKDEYNYIIDESLKEPEIYLIEILMLKNEINLK